VQSCYTNDLKGINLNISAKFPPNTLKEKVTNFAFMMTVPGGLCVWQSLEAVFQVLACQRLCLSIQFEVPLGRVRLQVELALLGRLVQLGSVNLSER
jgi:hypothetical protein